MSASKKPQSIASSGSKYLNATSGSKLVNKILKPTTAAKEEEDVSTIPKRNVPFPTSLYTRAYDLGETDYDDYEDTGSLRTVLHNQWFSNFSLNNTDLPALCRKDISSHKKKLIDLQKSEDGRFDRLVSMCGNMLGVDKTINIFGKMGLETRTEEYKSLLALNMERARETDDHEMQIQQNCKAYRIFQSMLKMGFAIEEDTYGPFLKHLIDKDMVHDFYFFLDIFKDGGSATLPRLAYYEMLLRIRLKDKDRIKQLIHDYSLYDGEDKHLFQESYLLAMCQSDSRRELLMLLETFDVTKASSEERLSNIFTSLGMLSMEAYAQKFLLELKTSGAELATLTNCIYDYAISITTLAVEDGGSKFKQLHSELELVPTSTDYEKLIRHYCKLLKVHVAIDLADEMFTVGTTPSLETIHTMLDACAESYDYNMGYRIYSMIRCQGLKPNDETFRSLLSLTVILKDFKGAYDMLREMVEMDITPTSNIYNTIMAGYFWEKNIHGGLAVLKQMQKANVEPDSQTFSYLISNSISGEDMDKILHAMDQSDIQVTKPIIVALINGFSACGEFEKAKQVVLSDQVLVKKPNEMRRVLVSALASHGQLSDALTIYEEIKQAGCSLEPKAALHLIERLRLQSDGQLDRLLQLQQDLHDSDYFVDACYKVAGYCVRHNHLSSAVEMLKKIKDNFAKFADDEVTTENIFDEVFCEFVKCEPKDIKFGLKLLQAVKEEIGLQPSRNILDFLLDACVSANDLSAAFFIWKEYQMEGLPYNVLSFLRMYRTLLALGDLNSAKEILKKIQKDDRHISCVLKGFQATYLRAAPQKKKKKNKKKTSQQFERGLYTNKELMVEKSDRSRKGLMRWTLS